MDDETRRVLSWLEDSRNDPEGIAVLADHLAEKPDAKLIRETLLRALNLTWDEASARNVRLKDALAEREAFCSKPLARNILRSLHDALVLMFPDQFYRRMYWQNHEITLGHVCLFSDDDLRECTPGIGEASYLVLRCVLEAHNLKFNGK